MPERRRAGIHLAQVSRELDVRADSLRQREQTLGLTPSPGPRSGEGVDDELHRLRRALDILRMERDFQKTAAAYFKKAPR